MTIYCISYYCDFDGTSSCKPETVFASRSKDSADRALGTLRMELRQTMSSNNMEESAILDMSNGAYQLSMIWLED